MSFSERVLDRAALVRELVRERDVPEETGSLPSLIKNVFFRGLRRAAWAAGIPAAHVHEGIRLQDGSGWVAIGETLAEDVSARSQVR